MNKSTVKIGIILILTAIILGAFFKHSLKDILSIEQIDSFDTGIKYQMLHALALIILGFNSNKIKFEKLISYIFIVGIILFCFSIYFLTCQQIIGLSASFLWPLTPIGGFLLIISWTILFFSINYKK